MRKIVISLFLLLLFSCNLNNVKKKLESYTLNEKNNKWALNGIGYYINTEKFIDFNNDGIGDIRGISENIHYFKSNSPNSLNLDFIILGNVFNSEDNFNKYVGEERDLTNLIRIADKNGIKILLDVNLDLYNPNYKLLLKKYLKIGIAGFKINFKNIDKITEDKKNDFCSFIKEIKEEYCYLFICCKIDKRENEFLRESCVDAIEWTEESISDINFNTDFHNIINFNINEKIDIVSKLIFTLPQIPIIQYGSEFGIEIPELNSIANNLKDSQNNATFLMYKTLIKLRKDFNININSKFLFHSNDNNIFSFFIINEDKKYFLVINKKPYLSLCYLKQGEWQKEINIKENEKSIVLREAYGDSVNTKYYIPKNDLGVFGNIKDYGLKIFEILDSKSIFE